MSIRYVSTRGTAPELNFADALLTGLATDGGLYVPETWPTLPTSLPAGGYAEVAAAVMMPFVEGSIAPDAFEAMVADAYATFDHPDVVPVVPIGDNIHIAEIFWGPTLAFKDIALQLVGRLFDYELQRRGTRVTVVGATSGDTGSAAIEALRDREAVEVFILHPKGRVSDVQRRQMTTVDAPNVHNIAIEGTFDDCQDMVKAMFADTRFRYEVGLAAVNSINWARVMAQVVYYVTSARAVAPGGESVAFSVPTGNFGNVFAGYGARRMGLPIDQLIVGSNSNDILTRFFDSGSLETRGVHPTTSPSMDIQVSSNLERLLFDVHGRDGAAAAEMMLAFRGDGSAAVADDAMAPLGEVWSAAAFDDAEVAAEIESTRQRSGMTLDPHSAIGVAAARARRRAPDIPVIALATAHPAKFPDAVEAATGQRPALPERLADLFERPEHMITLPNTLQEVQQHIENTRTEHD